MEIEMRLTITLIFSLTTAPVFSTNAGSVVSSFYAEPINWNGADYYPVGLTIGDGAAWVMYGFGVMTKRNYTTGSILTSFFMGWSAVHLGWDDPHKWIYATNLGSKVYWFNSTDGSLLGSFGPIPEGVILRGCDYDETKPSAPIWVTQAVPPRYVWNLSTTGSVVNSYIPNWDTLMPMCLAYDGTTPGGPSLFVGVYSDPALIWVLNPANGSVLRTFPSPTSAYSTADLSWDGQYLWALDNGPFSATLGWVYRFVAYDYPNVKPASLGTIKALYR